MRFLTTIVLAMLLAAPLSHAQQPVPAVSTARSFSSQAGSATPRSVALASPSADRPLSTAPEWAAMANRTTDSTETDPVRRARIVEGVMDLIVGGLGLGGGTVAGIGAYKLFSDKGNSEWAVLGTVGGILMLTAAIGGIATGIYFTIRGIRILQGKNPTVGSEPSSPPPRLPPPSNQHNQHSFLTLTVSL